MKLYAIGHSNVALDVFLSALSETGITQMVDIRCKPRSRFAHFNGCALATTLQGRAIEYTFMGDQLGGLPRDPGVASTWKQGSINPMVIAHLRTTDHWRAGIAELLQQITSSGQSICIMCSEGDPAKCHRSAVVADVVAATPPLRVEHIAIARYASPQPAKATGIELP